MRRTLRTIHILALCWLSYSVQAAELLINGDFESGDLSGWTLNFNTGSRVSPLKVAGAGAGWFGNSSPYSGTFSAYSRFDGAANSRYTLFQDVLIPDAVQSVLIAHFRVVLNGMGIASLQPREFEIGLRDNENHPLTILHESLFHMKDLAYTDTGWQSLRFDLSEYAGQQVRLYFEHFVPESYTGPAVLELDGLSLQTYLPQQNPAVDSAIPNLAVDEPVVWQYLLAGIMSLGLFRIRRAVMLKMP